MTEGKEQHLKKLMAKFDYGMLVTQSTGALHARPMAIAEQHDDGALYFAASKQSGKAEEIDQNPQVSITMQDGNQSLSLSGRAETVHERDLIERYFSNAWKIWFPEGMDDPDLILIKVEPQQGEYWDMSNTADKARFAFEAGKAYLQQEPIDTDKLSKHGNVGLN